MAATYQWLVLLLAIVLLSASFFASRGLLRVNADDLDNRDRGD